MNKTITAFMTICLTVITIAAILYVIGTDMMENETDKYKTHIEENINEFFTP